MKVGTRMMWLPGAELPEVWLDLGMSGYDLCEIYVLKKLHKDKIAENEKRQKCNSNDREDEKVFPVGCLCWNFKKSHSNSNAQSMGSEEKLVTSSFK
ncbi:hypothetical protein L6452_04945 [Arctium lappa]|uniref:Uncharacterized protein n=1 Tax=Arctium lappa TaxID=4217 RepID=A0ACB9EFQ6_ARCLA|nr:hypothetical protein L6452_04945 [Arctium lappa]